MKKSAETFCPIFTGFYNTIFEVSDNWADREFDNETDFREHYPKLANRDKAARILQSNTDKSRKLTS